MTQYNPVAPAQDALPAQTPLIRWILYVNWGVQLPLLAINGIYLALIIGIIKNSPAYTVTIMDTTYTITPTVEPYVFPLLQSSPLRTLHHGNDVLSSSILELDLGLDSNLNMS